MYDISDTIVALSSGEAKGFRKIIRISGDSAFEAVQKLTGETISAGRQIIKAKLNINTFAVEVLLYIFCSPNSYTGDDLVEIHCSCSAAVVEEIIQAILALNCRSAGAGEFTYRSFINGKLTLSQAEAVMQIVAGANQYQLAAGQKLFSGNIENKISGIRASVIELLSLLEANMDFSTEQIEMISTADAIERAGRLSGSLEKLLAGAITFEQIASFPAVVFSGCANAGKSSLVNCLIGCDRSIVSDTAGTTRDVLQHWLKLNNCDCVVSDTAGVAAEPSELLEILANAAALNAVETATAVVFCVDVSKKDFAEDLAVLNSIKNRTIIFVATKSDLAYDEKRISGLKLEFIFTSSKTKAGIEQLKQKLQTAVVAELQNSSEAAGKTALTARHISAVKQAIESINKAAQQIALDSYETAAVYLRDTLGRLAEFNNEYIDEKILDNIFSQFCIGK